MDTTQTTTEATPDLSTADGREAHFEAALAAALETTGEELPSLSEVTPTDPVTGLELNNDAEIQEAEDLQAHAEKKEKVVKEKPETSADDEEVEDKDNQPDKTLSPGTLGKARRLLAEGKVEEALELALGVNFDKIEPTTKQWKGVKRYAQEARQEAQEARDYANREIAQARHVVTTLKPFVDAAQAYLKGDIATFLQLATGDTPEQFQEKLIKSVHSGPESDPRLVARLEAIEKERIAEREAFVRELQKRDAETSQARYEQAVMTWKQDVSKELAASDNDSFKKLATKPAFVQKVYDKQVEFMDRRTRMTIDTLEAAEMVFDELYGDLIPTPAGGQTGFTQSPKGQRSETPTRQGKASVNLRNTKTEAAPTPFAAGEYSRENQEKIFNHYVNLTEANLAQG